MPSPKTRLRWLFPSLHGYRRGWLRGDALAGLTLAAIAIPEQLATARLIGMPPVTGLIAFLAGTLAIASFGKSRTLSVGADSTIAPIIAGSVLTLAATGTAHYAGLVVTLTLIVGVILLLSKPLQLGWVADMLSVPVTTGFLAGIGVHVIAGQMPAILDYSPSTTSLLDRIVNALRHLPDANMATLLIGAGVFLVSQFSERVNRLLPGPLLGIGLSALAVWALPSALADVPVMQPLQLALPDLHIVMPARDDLIFLMPAALVVALLCMMQTAAVEQSQSRSPLKSDDTASDFAAIGAGSLLSGLFGSFAVNSSPPRTAVVASAGGRSQASGLFAAAILLAVVLLFARVFAYVPQAALAGVLVYIGVRLFHIGTMARIWRSSKWEFLLVLASAGLAIVMPVGIGVGLSIVLSMMHSIYNITSPRCAQLERVKNTTIWWPPDGKSETERMPGVLVFSPGAPLNFTNAGFILAEMEQMIAAMSPPCRLVVIEASGVIDIDYTGAQALGAAIAALQADGVDVAFARMESARAKQAAVQTGLIALVGEDHVFQSVEGAVRRLAPPDGAETAANP